MNYSASLKNGCNGEQGQTRVIILALVFFVLGATASALWFSFRSNSKAPIQSSLAENNIAPRNQETTTPPPATAPTAPSAVPASHSSAPPAVAQPDPIALAAIKQSIPNVNAISLEEGTRILRATALVEFLKTTDELKARQKNAEQKFIEGQNNSSTEQQRLATKQLRDLQAEQVEKLQQIAAKSRSEIQTFQQLKRAAR
jgi:hypothetical protein